MNVFCGIDSNHLGDGIWRPVALIFSIYFINENLIFILVLSVFIMVIYTFLVK